MNPYAVHLLSPLHECVRKRRPSDIESNFGYGVWAVDMEWPFTFEVGFAKLWSQDPRGRGHLCGLGTGRGIILKWIWRELWGCRLNSGDYGKRPVAACCVHGYATSYAVKRGRFFDQLSGYQLSCQKLLIDVSFFNWQYCWPFHFKLSFNTFFFQRIFFFVPQTILGRRGFCSS